MIKLCYSKFCRGNSRRWKRFLFIFISIFNFAFGLVLLSSFLFKIEKSKILTEPIIDQISKQIPETIKTLTEESIEIEYQYYFRIDYTIIQSICRPIHIFHTNNNLISIQNLTNSKLNKLLTRNLTITTDIISFNPIFKKPNHIKEIRLYEDPNIRCDYLLKLYIGFSFPLYCNEICQFEQVEQLICKRKPFDHPINDSFLLTIYPIDSSGFVTLFNIQQMLILQSSKYFDRTVYIRSYDSNLYFLSLIFDSDAYQLSITMSKTDRSLFLIKDGLFKKFPEIDCSSISISFLSESIHNSYIRHEDGRIKLKKIIRNNLFKTDATFYLIFSKTNKDMVAFKAINLQQSYISIDPNTPNALILDNINYSQSNIDSFQRRFLFKFIYD